jgi:hypothetical protein
LLIVDSKLKGKNMAMEVEYVDMGAEDISEVAVSDMAAADIVNGAGEVVVERDEAEWVEHSPESQTATCEINPPLVDEQWTVEKEAETKGISFKDVFADRMAEGRHKAEWEHEHEVATAKESHTQASLARQAAEEVFKAAKATEKACLSELSALINRGPDYPKPINQGGDADPIAAAVRNDKDSRPIPVDDPNADQSWRAIPTSEILDGIKGMGDKKRDSILSLIPTMGDFEDLRGQASIAHKPFRSVLPKGVGQGMADEIEERALSRMRKHQLSIESTRPVNQVVEDPVEIEVDVDVEYEDAETEPEASTLVESDSSTIDIDDV